MMKVLELRGIEGPAWLFTVETSLNRNDIQNLAEKIKNDFEKKGFLDWSYKNIVKQMEKDGVVSIIDDCCDCENIETPENAEYIEIFL